MIDIWTPNPYHTKEVTLWRAHCKTPAAAKLVFLWEKVLKIIWPFSWTHATKFGFLAFQKAKETGAHIIKSVVTQEKLKKPRFFRFNIYERVHGVSGYRGVVSVGSVGSMEPTDFCKVWNGTHRFWWKVESIRAISNYVVPSLERFENSINLFKFCYTVQTHHEVHWKNFR